MSATPPELPEWEPEPSFYASREGALHGPESLPLAHEAELTTPRGIRWPGYVVGAGVIAYAIFVVVAVVSGEFALVEAVPLVPLLGYVAFRIGRRLGEIDDDPDVARLVIAAFWAKMLGTIVRAAVTAWYYDNRSDALDYHKWGQYLAPQFRSLDFSNAPPLSGTDFMRAVTGGIYSVTGASQTSGAIVMSFLSFCGLLLLWRSFKRAVPTGATRRYAILVLFLPSLLYWPSALGKEGWAIFCLGLASYGVARVVTGSIPTGLVCFAGGIWGVTYLRPHVALIIFCGVVLAATVGKSRKPGGVSHVLRMILFGGLFALGLVLMSSTASFFGVPSLSQETNNQILADAEGRTAEAGSTFTPVTIGNNPAMFPPALVTVLLRPFPFEAGNPVAAISALEGVFLVVFGFRERSRLRSIPRMMRRTPYVAYCVGIVITFVYAFSAFSNFGILSRQRCQVLPFFLVVFCLPKWEREGHISAEEAIEGRDTPAPVPYEISADPADPYAGRDTVEDPYSRFVDDRAPWS